MFPVLPVCSPNSTTTKLCRTQLKLNSTWFYWKGKILMVGNEWSSVANSIPISATKGSERTMRPSFETFIFRGRITSKREIEREREKKKRNKLLRKKNIWKLESLGAAGRRHSGAIRPLFSLHTSHSFHSFHLEGPRIPKNPKRSQTT